MALSSFWHSYNTVFYRLPSFTPLSSNIYAFSFFNTLIKSDRGLLCFSNPDDWVWFSDLVPSFFNQFTIDTSTFVIFINYLSSDLTDLLNLTQLIDNCISQLPIQPFVFVSTSADQFHKPNLGLWSLFLLLTQLVPSSSSFFCGDNEFASALNLPFYTPSQLFPPQPSPPFPFPTELIITVGQPDSGWQPYSSYLASTSHYLILPSTLDSLSSTRSSLLNNQKVIIAGPNPRFADRLPFIHLALLLQIPVRIFWFTMIPPSISNLYVTSFERPTFDTDQVPVYRIN